MLALSRSIVGQCLAAGFALAGVCPARPTDRRAELRSWLEAGRHGTMDWLARDAEARADPELVLPGARAAVLVADLYAARVSEASPDGGAAGGPATGLVARYARGRDYHAVIKRRLHNLADRLRERADLAPLRPQFRSFVDTAPVLEREHAARAGLGWIGKHTLLIHPRVGSYFLLGGIFTDLPLVPPPEQESFDDHCGTCTRCIDACPTGAISPYSVDASRCISYLTIEHRGPIDPSFHAAMGWRFFGCDICQDVCPHNSARPGGETGQAAGVNERYAAAPGRTRPELADVLAWTEHDRRRVLSGSSMKRATLEMLKRNALVLAGNALARRDDPALRRRLTELASDPGEGALVNQTAREVLARLESPSRGA